MHVNGVISHEYKNNNETFTVKVTESRLNFVTIYREFFFYSVGSLSDNIGDNPVVNGSTKFQFTHSHKIVFHR